MKNGQVYTSYDALTLKKKETFTLELPTVNGGKDVDWIRRIFRAEETTSIYGYYNRKDDENFVYGKITDWVPKAKITLLHATEDTIVPYENTQSAYDAFKAAGCNVTKHDIVGKDHKQGGPDFYTYCMLQLVV